MRGCRRSSIDLSGPDPVAEPATARLPVVTKKSLVLSCRRILLTLAVLLTLLLLAGSAAVAIAVARLWPQLPALDRVLHYQPQQPLQVFTADGVPIAQFGEENREFVPIARR